MSGFMTQPLTRRSFLPATTCQWRRWVRCLPRCAPRPNRTTLGVAGRSRTSTTRFVLASARYAIPGVSLAMLYRGRRYVRGYGVTNVDYPVRIDGNTVFRAASNTKTFTGTAVMRLVDEGRLDLDATVRSYLPDFRTSQSAVADRVTLRQVLNHSAGWLGDYLVDTGQGDDALAEYVARFVDIPQLTPVGQVFSYNNTALSLAGRSSRWSPDSLTKTPFANC